MSFGLPLSARGWLFNLVVIEAVLVCIGVHIITRVSGVSPCEFTQETMDISWILTRTQDSTTRPLTAETKCNPKRLGEREIAKYRRRTRSIRIFNISPLGMQEIRIEVSVL